MTNFKLTVQYDGTRFSGWQKQGNTDNTIQGKIENILSKMTGEEIEIHGSGRTDAGVHAIRQIANFKTNATLSELEVRDSLNKYLPLDIRILDAEKTDNRFHARLNAKGKHYRYTIDNGEVANIFERKYMTRLTKNYDLEAMKKAAKLFIGEHDFKSFCDNKRMKKSTVRRISDIQINNSDGIITIDFYGNGFLYHMVRILTGTLLMVGTHELSCDDIPDIIEKKSRDAAGFTAPPQGFCLVEVDYN